MKQNFTKIIVETNKRNLTEITEQVHSNIQSSEITDGLVTLYIKHTSASLIIQENADPDVQIDLINYFNKLVPMDENLYTHNTEGRDDMPAHIKSALTNNQISLSIKNKELMLGTWQGIYLGEFRNHGGARKLVLTLMGE